MIFGFERNQRYPDAPAVLLDNQQHAGKVGVRAYRRFDVRGGPPRRLQPVPVRKLSAVEQFIADWSLGDAIAPDDAWRPWGRRKRLRRDIARLTAPPPLPPDHLRP